MPKPDAAGAVVFFQEEPSNQEAVDDEEDYHARRGGAEVESEVVQHDDQRSELPVRRRAWESFSSADLRQGESRRRSFGLRARRTVWMYQTSQSYSSL